MLKQVVRLTAVAVALTGTVAAANPAKAAGSVAVFWDCKTITIIGETNNPIDLSGYFVGYKITNETQGGAFSDIEGVDASTYINDSFEVSKYNYLPYSPTDVYRVQVWDADGSESNPNLANVLVTCGNTDETDNTTYRGPSIPKGFELRTITCDTPVFGTPGGAAVGENRLRAGQTWFVNPTSVEGANGTDYTEVFVSSYQNVYIPTRCVQ
jgi:hypothetical protein